MIQLNDVSFAYKGGAAIHHVDLFIGRGVCAAITGTNGAGKTTVVKLIRGLLRPCAGSIILDGTDIAEIRPSALAAKVGFLFQNPDRQLCCSTIREELMFTLQNTVADRDQREALCQTMIARFGFDEAANPLNLSRGERQRVALASVMVSRPNILILDEPTTGLDHRECVHIMDLVREFNRDGATVLMVCHDMELVLDYADRVVVMDNGKIVADAPALDVFYNDTALGQANILPPQLIGLSRSLSTPLGRVGSVSSMADVIQSTKNGEVGMA